MPFIKNVAIFARKGVIDVVVSPFCQIDGGGGTSENFSVAIDKNGRAWAWGINNSGQLGNNSITPSSSPVSVLGNVKTFCKIAAAGGGGSQARHTIAIDKNGRLWSWGFNGVGQLGNNSITSQRTPVSVLGAVKTFCKINIGADHSLGITRTGRLWAWGGNFYGQLGDNTIVASRLTPVSVAGGVKTFCEIIAGGNFYSFAIDKNGRLWAWGLNTFGNLGDNSTASRITPVSVCGSTKTFCKIEAGYAHSLAIEKNGRVWAWGRNDYGQLGDAGFVSQRTPVSIAGAVKTFCEISAGGNHSLAIDKNGRLWSWGYNANGQLGNNSLSSIRTPVSVLGAVKTFCKIAAGDDHSVAIDKNGRMWAWGRNLNGELGDKNITNKCTPISVAGTTKTFCKISAAGTHNLAIEKNGRVWSWGTNGSGQLGDNSITDRCTPVSILGAVKTFCHISAGANHTLAIDKNGRAWAWGFGSNGELGTGTGTIRTPVSVAGAIKTFCKISAGNNHSIAIDKNGRVWSWGFNGSGQLGDNSITQRNTPVSILGAVKTFCQISAGANHTLAIDRTGRAWSWGLNTAGELGDNTVTSRRTPVSVLGAVKTFCKIAIGNSFSLAIDKNGRLWAWGTNNNGQLGDGGGSLLTRRTPVSIAGAVKTFCEISAGGSHTLAIDKNGRVWAWGNNDYFQLGNNYNTRTPVRVCFL